ncbi:MAG: Cys-tRNA(Pro) deacylase [Eubacteriaceae bacterium]|jgi:Cys-tRNA(Pro)/Cys-tRNA(Cys) deacylase|nr:Cys-tRNA(Pro) deacylase [Eubacteriaceae bacterium]
MSKKKKKDASKTNVMRILDQAHLAYTAHYYDVSDGALDGLSIALKIGENPAEVFKTLVCQGHSGDFRVFVIPVGEELDLKKAARASGEKAVAMIHQKDLLPNTGYIHGGCSPVGMKKPYATFIDTSAEDQGVIYVSGGKVGTQVGLDPQALARFTGARFAPLTR